MLLQDLKYYPRHIVIVLLRLYQKTLSFDYGIFKALFPYGYCCFKPTCSDYAISAIEKYGIIKGGIKAGWRVMRCNPWSKGGWDPVE